MKEEIARVLKLVQEGKLSADDAAELIQGLASAVGECSFDAHRDLLPSNMRCFSGIVKRVEVRTRTCSRECPQCPAI